MTLADLLRKSARLHADRLAVACDGRSLTYAELFERSCRLVDALQLLGLERQDRVATLGGNALTTLEEITGLALGGFCRTPLHPRNSTAMHVHMLRHIGARALLVHEELLPAIADRLDEVETLEHVIVHGTGALTYEALLASASPADAGVPIGDDDLYLISFSAGTTGLPKGIVHTHRSWMGATTELALVLPRMREDDLYLAAGPLTHAASTVTWPLLAHGAGHLVMPEFAPGAVLDHLERDRCTFTLLVPTMIAGGPDARSRDLSSLRAVIYAGAPIAEATVREAHAVWGQVMFQLYGQTEGIPATVLAAEDHQLDGEARLRRRLRSAGRPTPNTNLRILDDDGNELPFGEPGEITIDTPGRMREIWGDPETTADRITDDGWLRTRDIGYVDEDGFVYLADRKEDMIISGGYNIWPAEIEHALVAHPKVLEAAVVGVPHERWGETPKAVVVLREGVEADEPELIDWCREQVGSMKKPTSVVISDEPLPKSPVGKLLRRAVRDQHWPAGAEDVVRISGA